MNQIDSNDQPNESSPEETSSVVLPWGIFSGQFQKRSVEQFVGQVQISSTNSPLPPPDILERHQVTPYYY